MKKTECVKVVVRVRPMSQTEVNDQRKKIVDVDVSRGEVVIQNVKNDGDAERSFVFDQVFDHKAQQEQVYNDTALPIVENVMDGFNGTIFAYGQTGTGKTHTMEGRAEPPHERGIIPRTFDHVFRVIEGTPNIQFLVRVSYLELYNEEVRDLLSQNHLNKLELREKPDEGVYVKDLSRLIVSSVNDLNNQLKFGKNNRTVGQTKMNLESSRSHSIFCLTIESSEMSVTNEQHIKVGKLNLVDLAGSERQSKTQAVGEMFKQAININQSLTTLGNVITALVDGKSQHIPYRDSKLTRLLQDSLGGNTKTVMVANVGPADYNYDETMQTLRYANRAKNIKNKPKINEDPKDAMIREYQEEINRLKDELSRKGGVGPGGKRITEQVIEVEDEDALNEIQQKAQKERAELQRQYNDTLKMTNIAEEEKKKLQQQLKEKMKMETNIKKEQEVMITKLKEMQQQILHGDKMKEQARQKEKELYKAKMELETREQEARRMAEELAKQEAAQVDVEQKFNNTKDEINAKTQKLNSLVSKIKDLKAQAQEQQQFRERQKEEILEDNRESLRQLSLMDFIIDHFISSDEVKKLQDKLEWSDEADDWIINEAEVSALKKPQSAFNHKRPLCNFAKMAISFGDPNPRFRPENILQLDLELPQRLTEDFTEEQSQKVQEVLNVALNDDEEDQAMIQNEKQANVYIEDPSVINKEAILNPPSNPQKARLQSANKRALAKRPGSGIKR